MRAATAVGRAARGSPVSISRGSLLGMILFLSKRLYGIYEFTTDRDRKDLRRERGIESERKKADVVVVRSPRDVSLSLESLSIDFIRIS